MNLFTGTAETGPVDVEPKPSSSNRASTTLKKPLDGSQKEFLHLIKKNNSKTTYSRIRKILKSSDEDSLKSDDETSNEKGENSKNNSETKYTKNDHSPNKIAKQGASKLFWCKTAIDSNSFQTKFQQSLSPGGKSA